MLVSVRQSQHTIEIKQEAVLGKQFELATQLWASATGQIYEPVYETIRILDRIDAIETFMYISLSYNTCKHTLVV